MKKLIRTHDIVVCAQRSKECRGRDCEHYYPHNYYEYTTDCTDHDFCEMKQKNTYCKKVSIYF